jgi:DMSO/TMAO reductase YedYZ molybdopterin-dependent catalytic subunit
MEKPSEIELSNSQVRNRTLGSFIIFGALIVAAIFGWKWVNKQPKDSNVPKPIRAILNTNQSIFNNIVFNENNLSAAYPLSQAAARVRVNGDIGMSKNFDAANWKLNVVKTGGDVLSISLDELKVLPKTEIVFDFKCIEGWSQVTHWGGVKFSDFVKKYNLSEECAMQYAGLATPDSGYYVGIDRKSMMHPQTLLCYEMNGRTLPVNQGYPLRLIIPVKYGIKHLKRIGTISFSNQRPRDYWYERGYDYYSGL